MEIMIILAFVGIVIFAAARKFKQADKGKDYCKLIYEG